jgi:hypothetical protein
VGQSGGSHVDVKRAVMRATVPRNEIEWSFAPPTEAVHTTLLGGNLPAPAVAVERLPDTVNYFIGNDPTGRRHTIPLHARPDDVARLTVRAPAHPGTGARSLVS